MEVYAASKHFTNLMKREEAGAVEMVLSIMKGGLYSRSKDVAMWSLKVLSKIAYDLGNLELSKPAWDWFVAVDGGLDSVVYCMQKHSELLDAAVEMMASFGRENSNELFTQLLKNVVNDTPKYWRIAESMVRPLSLLPKPQTGIEAVLGGWVDSATKIAENDGRHPISDRAVALGLLSEVWVHFSAVIESKEEVADRVLSVLRRATRDKCPALQTFAFAQLFVLLEIFAAGRKSYAPILYKSLAFTFLETHAQEDTRELIMGNLAGIFAAQPAIPISIVTEPLVKQVQTSENVTYFFNLFDFEFVNMIATHQKLSLKNALLVMDMLAKTTINDQLFSGVAVQPFIKIATRFRAEETVGELLIKFVKVPTVICADSVDCGDDTQHPHKIAFPACAQPGEQEAEEAAGDEAEARPGDRGGREGGADSGGDWCAIHNRCADSGADNQGPDGEPGHRRHGHLRL